MVKYASQRDTLEGFLRDLDTRIQRQERHTHSGVGMGGGGANFVSTDYNNATHLGTDGGVYTREIVAKSSPPTANDFGGSLRIGSIWVETTGL